MADQDNTPCFKARIVGPPEYRLEIRSTFPGETKKFGLCSGKEAPLEEGWRIVAQIPLSPELFTSMKGKEKEVIEIAQMLHQLGRTQGVREQAGRR